MCLPKWESGLYIMNSYYTKHRKKKNDIVLTEKGNVYMDAQIKEQKTLAL